jgi:threonine dehydratase
MTTLTELPAAVWRAESRIRSWIAETPLEPSPLAAATGGRLYLKLENLQRTGSFKARGAFSKLLSLDSPGRSRGVIAASTGNHGAAVAYAAAALETHALIVVPSDANPGKVAAIEALGGKVEVHGDDSAVAETYARARAADEQIPYISPYNDPEVVAGQGTIGVELAGQLPRVDAVFIALGGGGLLAGVGALLKSIWPGTVVVGCSPENSAVMIESIRAGRILDLPSRPTLSDGTAGGVEAGAITFEWCRDLADQLVTVSEDEIRQAMGAVLETHHLAVEGAAGVALAAYFRHAAAWREKNVVVILCGGNLSAETQDKSIASRLGGEAI